MDAMDIYRVAWVGANQCQPRASRGSCTGACLPEPWDSPAANQCGRPHTTADDDPTGGLQVPSAPLPGLEVS